MRDDAFHRRILVDADHGRAEGSLPSADLYDGRRHGGAVKRVGQIDARGRNDDDAVDLAGHQRFDAFVLRMLLIADAEQQLLSFHVDDRFQLIKQSGAEMVGRRGDDQSDGVGGGAAQRTRRIVDRIVEFLGGGPDPPCDVVVLGAFAGEHTGDRGDGDVGHGGHVGDGTGRRLWALFRAGRRVVVDGRRVWLGCRYGVHYGGWLSLHGARSVRYDGGRRMRAQVTRPR